jgi:signal transduction histidine kinase
MSLILLVSTGIRLAALGWSLVLLRRVQDWRMGCFTVMLALMVLRQALTLEATVLADATQMHQTLMNLCANAEYAMREAGGILEIGVDHVHVDDTFLQRAGERNRG